MNSFSKQQKFDFISFLIYISRHRTISCFLEIGFTVKLPENRIAFNLEFLFALLSSTQLFPER